MSSLAFAGLLAAAACRTTTTERPAARPYVAVEPGVAARTWHVIANDESIGRVVAYESHERPEDPMFVVQNAWSQDLGMIDGLGRAWRFRPHRAEAEWLLTGTGGEGAAALLGAARCELREVALERAREAAAGR
jgi:hypothetical protein